METSRKVRAHSRLFATSCLILLSAAAHSVLPRTALAQTQAAPQARITQAIDNAQRFTIPGSRSAHARPDIDAGRISSEMKLEGMRIDFQRTAAQEADLTSLMTAQLDPTSPLYHQWLTPEQFGARFGVSDADLAKVKLWLEQQGFTVNSVARAKNHITFSGSAAQAEAAFGTEIHYYAVNGVKKFAPSSELTIPSAFASVVRNVSNLSSFRPHARVKNRGPVRAPKPQFTSSQTGNHFLTPGDVAVIYDIKPAYSAGLNGTGQSIAVVGQSAIALADIENFQAAAGLAKKDPTLVLVPNSGTSTVSSGDESESDLDLEYSGGIAPGATIYFVYVGASPNYSVFNSIQYAIDNRIAPIISTSYGDCETDFNLSDFQTLDSIFKQAATQGQTVIGPSGDSGSTDCQGLTDLTMAQQQALAVDYPASSAYVTGMGGSEFLAADVASTNTQYWQSASGTDIIASALSYIPEQVWNDDDSTNGLSAGGGGISTFSARPTWQAGVPGIPTGTFRLVPDISLTASPNNAGFLYCSSDTSQTGVTGSCTPGNGFRDSSDTSLTVAGGTSFDAPIFAALVAIINQKLNSSGQGLINPTLYTLAANASTYASAFHDIDSGSNACTAGVTFCGSAGGQLTQYAATTGYDMASGLGSIDFNNLLNAWPTGGSSTAIPTTTTLSPATTTPASGASDVITITVAATSGTTASAPTGSVSVSVDGGSANVISLVNGAASYTFSSTAAGAHTVIASYSGDATYASSTSSTLTLTIGSASAKSFTVTATPVTVSSGSSGSSTVTVTPKNGYTGTISWTVTSNPAFTNGCLSLPDTAVTGTSPVSSTLSIGTSTGGCLSGASIGANGKKRSGVFFAPVSRFTNGTPFSPAVLLTAEAGLGILGFAVVGFLLTRQRKLGAFAAICILATVAFAMSACGGGGSSSGGGGSTNVAKGTYTVNIVGTDSASSAITASTSVTITVD